MIVQSQYTEEAPQPDGRRYVRETHTDSEGNDYSYEWLGTQNAALVLEERAALLNAQLAAREEAAALVSGTLLPISKLQFRELFTVPERKLIDALNAGFEAHSALNDEQKASIRTGLEDYRMATNITRPFDARVLSMLGLYQALGFLTADRVKAIADAGNG